VLVLDEATNALDAMTEKEVLSNIITECSNKNVIIITHNVWALSDYGQITIVGPSGLKVVRGYQELFDNDFDLKSPKSLLKGGGWT